MATFSHCTNCDTVALAGDFSFHIERDPFCTGDSPDEIVYTCPHCHSDEVEFDVVACDCGEALPLDGYDDCAACILLDQYTHTREYDAEARADARAALPEADLVNIEEQIARTIDRGRA